MTPILQAAAAGVIATAISDIWQRFILLRCGQPAPRWSAVGRWVMGFSEGRVCDLELAGRPARRGEEPFGWLVHYVVGMGYALLYLACLRGLGLKSGFGAAIVFGVVTLAAPFLFMKPCMGGGFFGWKSAHPWISLCKTLSSHLSFGLGLWIGFLIVTL